MVDPIVEIWDIAAVALCVREAGGRFTCLSGSESLEEKSGVASNGHLHAEVLGTTLILAASPNICRFVGSAFTDPPTNLFQIKLPVPANTVSRKSLRFDPAIARVP